jgi:V/A-type H+-transporting ATPase subunit F
MKKVVFITPEDAEYGFRFTGAEQLVIKEEALEETLKTVVANEQTGLVVVDDRLIRGISEAKLRDMEKRWYGILLILPAPERPGAEVEDYAMRLIKRAIGYHVRVKL